MKKDKEFKNGEDDSEEILEHQEDESLEEEIEEEQEDESLFPFDKMIYQEKGENENDIHEYDMGSDQELNLGESESRTRRRNLGEEKGAGHEP